MLASFTVSILLVLYIICVIGIVTVSCLENHDDQKQIKNNLNTYKGAKIGFWFANTTSWIALS